MLGALEELGVVEGGRNVRVRLQDLDRAVAPVHGERAGKTGDVQVRVDRQAVDRQRGVDRGVGIDPVVVAKYHVQVGWQVLPVPGVVGETEQWRQRQCGGGDAPQCCR
ncbi:hypothetical protein D3C81_2018920 [compost metagenome]